MEARGRRAVLVFALALPLLTFLALLVASGGMPAGLSGTAVAFSYIVGICPAVFTGLVWQRLLEGGWCRLSRLAGVAAAHPLGAVPFFLPAVFLTGIAGVNMWLLCVPIFVGAALAACLLVEFVWPGAARGSLAETGRLPT